MQHWGVVPVLQPSCSPALVRYLGVPSCWQSMTCGLTLSHPAVLPICAALQEKKTVQVLFLVQLTLLFWGRQALYLGIRSVSVCQKEPYAIQAAQGYCQSYCWLPSFSFFYGAEELHRAVLFSCLSTFIIHWEYYLPTEQLACISSTANSEDRRSWHIETPQKLV